MKETNRWFRKNGATHLLLDGGALSVKNNETNDFYEAYVKDLYKGESLYVVEKKTNHFRFFVDLDYTPDDEDELLDFEKVVLEISKIVKLGPCFVAKAKPRKNNGKTKYGVHLVWPESVVDKKVANSIRMKLLNELGSDWERIIDASVYSGSGLRMIWSLKNENGSTPYVPWGKVSDCGFKFEKFEQVFPSVEHLKLFSIRISDDDISQTPTKIENENTEDLEKFIRENLPGQNNAKIVRISKCKNKKDYWVSTNSRYCQNVKREHKSNHVWFILKPYACTISQRCQDDECKNWEGRLYRFPSRLIPNEGSLDTRPHRTINDYLPDGWRKRD
jgi:hypothetical protein